jgi:hypothetical protein
MPFLDCEWGSNYFRNTDARACIALPDAHSIGRGQVEFLPGLNIECPVP